MNEGVEAYQVGGAEDGSTGTTHGGTQEGIRFSHGDSIFNNGLQYTTDALDTNTVSNEVGGVFGPNDPFTKIDFAKVGDEVEDFLLGLRSGDKLQEVHIADGVKEVGAEEVLFETCRQAVRDLGKGNTGGVGADDGIGFSHLIDTSEEFLLNRQVLYYHFADPITVSQLVEVVGKVTGLDKRGVLFAHEQGRLCSQCVLETIVDHAVTSRWVFLFLVGEVKGDDVHKEHLHASSSQESCNATAHDPGPDHCSFSDFSTHNSLLCIINYNHAKK